MPNSRPLEQPASIDHNEARLRVRHVSNSGTGAGTAQRMVLCPMVGREVVIQRCAFCRHSKEWIHDEETDALFLRCTYLASQP